MKPEEQRIAIAQACGYTAESNQGSMGGWIGKRNGKSVYDSIGYSREDAIIRVCPDYLNDLNAMHEAEKSLSMKDGTRSEYVRILQDTCGTLGATMATSQQRAEAFLRVYGLWTE